MKTTPSTALAVKADWEDMVFADREQAYGAYFLRKKYPVHLAISLLLVSFLAMAAVAGPVIARHWFGSAALVAPPKAEIVVIALPPPPPISEEIQEVIPPPPPPPAPPVASMASNIPVPTPDDELEDPEATIHEMDSLQKAPNISFEDREGQDVESPFVGEDIDASIPAIFSEPDLPKDTDFISVEEEPRPVNLTDITKLIGYPQMARDAGIQGMVVVRILVDKQGQYRDHKVINSAHVILDRAVQEQLRKLQFTPAIQGSKPIPFWVNIPFRFSLMQ